MRLASFVVLGIAAIVPVASASAHRTAPRTLRQGMRGSAVRFLQRELTQAGFATRRTGVFNTSTARAVRTFERRYRLTVNGTATPSFMRTLRRIRGYDLAAVDAPATTGAFSADASGGGGLTGTGTGTGTTTGTGTATGTTTTTGTTTGTTTTGTTGTTTTPGLSNHAYGSRVLRKGMMGTDVEDLQDYLTLAGYPTSVDGDFGPLTRKSVVTFQRATGLTSTGVVPRSQAMVLKSDVAKAIPASGTAGQATLGLDGTVTAPADAPAAVQKAIAAANSITSDPYIYGGGHASFTDTGYDCSGSVSFALHGGGLLSSPEDSTSLETYGEAGPGKWITIYADASHAFVVIAGLAFDTAHYGPTFPGGTGPRWLQPSDATANLSDGGDYIVRHPAGL